MQSKIGRLRGMRHLTTIQGLSGRSLPSSREQIVAEQARLEHERARLERELAMWQENQQRTAERLGAVVERLGLLTGALEPEPPPAERARRRRPGPEQPAAEQPEWNAFVLEY